MVTEEQVRKLVEEKLEGTASYIVDVKVGPTHKIIVEIDNDKGISIQDCVEVSRYVEQGLDRDQQDFELQVSSPGLSQPFKILRQYIKNIGREVEILLKDGNKITGKLLAANENAITVESQEKVKDEKTKKKKTIKKQQNLELAEVKETKIVISFK